MKHADPTDRFSNRVEAYAAHRPRYPRALLDLLRDEIGLRADWVIADIGSGTGISSEIFLDNGNLVYGVEPNQAMRQAAEHLLAHRPGFHSVNGRAEATKLAEGSIDLSVAAQAFHWFDPVAARAEFKRILRRRGWAALIWNTRRLGPAPFLRDYEQLLLTHGTDYRNVRHDSARPEVRAAFFGGAYEYRVAPNEQVLDLEGLRGRILSTSYVPAEGQPGFTEMMRDLDALFADHAEGGVVRMAYDAEVSFGRL